MSTYSAESHSAATAWRSFPTLRTSVRNRCCGSLRRCGISKRSSFNRRISPALFAPGSSTCSRNCPSPDIRSSGRQRSCTSARELGQRRAGGFSYPARQSKSATEITRGGYSGWLDQGAPEFMGTVDDGDRVAHAFNLAPDDLDADLPMEVVSTGLRYLIVPVRSGALARARISRDITELVQAPTPSSRSCSMNPPSKCGTGTTTESSRM